jgi:hypothetical protein
VPTAAANAAGQHRPAASTLLRHQAPPRCLQRLRRMRQLVVQ